MTELTAQQRTDGGREEEGASLGVTLCHASLVSEHASTFLVEASA